MLQLLSGLPLIFLDNLRCGIYPVLAGDFNRSPDRLENDLMTEHLERVVAVLAPTEPTQIGGGILDYGVIVDSAPYSQRVEALRNPQLASDHYPVAFLARSC